MRLRRPRLVFGILGVTLLILGLLLWRVPEMREAWQRASCIKREQARADREVEYARTSLGAGKVTKAQVREFLRANYPSVQVSEVKGQVHAGLMIFRFNDHDEMIDFFRMLPCPIA